MISCVHERLHSKMCFCQQGVLVLCVCHWGDAGIGIQRMHVDKQSVVVVFFVCTKGPLNKLHLSMEGSLVCFVRHQCDFRTS